MNMDISAFIQSFSDTPVLVIGDVMIDAYLWGKVERISPEAPVPVINVTRKEDRLGGAANVALNLLALGAKPYICSVVGADRKGEELEALVRGWGLSAHGIISSEGRITTVKTRVISQSQQMMRVDEEQTDDLNSDEENRFIQSVKSLTAQVKPKVVVFEDYNKGVLTHRVIETLIAFFNQEKIATCVDPKKNNFFSYKNVTLFKPNLKELREGLKIEIDKSNKEQLSFAVKELEKQLHPEISLITLSEMGVMIKKNAQELFFPAHVRNIADVSGAGDTVIAVAALCLARESDIRVLAQLSNLAGGLVCERVGVVPIDKEQLIQEAIKEFLV